MTGLVITLLLFIMAAPAVAQGLGTWCNPVFGCIQVTCDLVRWGAATMPQSQVDAYKAQATPAQLAAGQRCLGLPVAKAKFRSGGKKFKK